MTFYRNNTAIIRYTLKRLEMALGLALILLIAINEAVISRNVAIIIFMLVIAVCLPKLVHNIRQMKQTSLMIDGPFLWEKSPLGDKKYRLQDFEILLYKKNARAITAFALMSEREGIKIEYYPDMNQLFQTLSQHVKVQKKIPWWQRL